MAKCTSGYVSTYYVSNFILLEADKLAPLIEITVYSLSFKMESAKFFMVALAALDALFSTSTVEDSQQTPKSKVKISATFLVLLKQMVNRLFPTICKLQHIKKGVSFLISILLC